jgi:hypothetical protein
MLLVRVDPLPPDSNSSHSVEALDGSACGAFMGEPMQSRITGIRSVEVPSSGLDGVTVGCPSSSCLPTFLPKLWGHRHEDNWIYIECGWE